MALIIAYSIYCKFFEVTFIIFFLKKPFLQNFDEFQDVSLFLNKANDKQKYKFNVINHISLCGKGILHQTDPHLEVYPLS